MKKFIISTILALSLVASFALAQYGTSPFGSVPPDDTAYNAATWNGSYLAPTQSAVRDQIEASALIWGAVPYLTQTPVAGLTAEQAMSLLGTGAVWNTTATGVQSISAALTSIGGLTETNGGILYGTADDVYAWLGAGTANYLFQANGAAAPSWTNTPTLGTPASGTLTNCTGLPQAGVVGLTTADSPTFVTTKLSGLTDGYLPYHVSDVAGLADSPVWTDATKVGIGTATPLTKLDVAGSSRITGTATSVLTGSINPTASTAVVGVGTLFTIELIIGDRITVSTETRTVTVITDNTNLTVSIAFTDTANDTSPDKLAAILVIRDSSDNIDMVVSDQGFVGIGTTTPVYTLDIAGGNAMNIGAALGSIRIGGQVAVSGSQNDHLRLNVEGSGYIKFTNGGATEWMRLTGGNVGIGTATPDAHLHVELDNAATAVAVAVGRLSLTSTGTPAAGLGPSLEFEVETAAGSPGNQEVIAAVDGIATDVTGASEDGALVFRTMKAGAAATEDGRFAQQALFLPETTTPTALPNYGAFYWKGDNIAYGQDGEGVEHILGGDTPVFKSYMVTTQGLGANPDVYAGGFYEAPAAEAVLNQGALTQTYGTANKAQGAHAFLVAKAVGTVDAGTVSIVVSGISITEAGVRNASGTETIVVDITALATDAYYETDLKWLGQVTYTLTPAGATTFAASFNYGFAKYEDFGNRDFKVTDFEVCGFAGANDADFDIILYHHSSTGWTYSAAAFVPGGTVIAQLSTDYTTDDQLFSAEPFAYKRSGLATSVSGSGSEGAVVDIITTANNAVEYATVIIGVEL